MKRLFILYSLLLFGWQVSAQQITWTGATNTDWTDSTNWSPKSVPNPCNRIIIPAVGTNRYPSLVSNIFVDSLVLSGGNVNTNNNLVSFIAGGNGIQSNVYTKLSSGDSTKIFGRDFKAQSPDSSHSIRQSTSTCAPTFRFEINQGENWIQDIEDENDNGLPGGRRIKERAELYLQNASITAAQDVWVSYSIYIEPGDSIKYSNDTHYCILGQWHAGNSIQTSGPSWQISLRNQGKLTLTTRGQDTLTPPFPPGYPLPVDRASTTVSRGAWHHILTRTRFDISHGQMQWWVDGVEIPFTTGNSSDFPIGYTHSVVGYWKFGIYRTSNAKNLVVRYANVEVAHSGASLLARRNNELSLD